MLRLFIVRDGSATQLGSPASTPFPSTGKYTTLEAHVRGDTFEVWQSEVLLRTDRDAAIEKGAIGLITNLTENYFKDIKTLL